MQVIRAIVLVTVESGSEKEIIRTLRNIPSVKQAYEIYGGYDIIAMVEADTFENIKRTVSYTIRNIANIRNTLTMIVVDKA